MRPFLLTLLVCACLAYAWLHTRPPGDLSAEEVKRHWPELQDLAGKGSLPTPVPWREVADQAPPEARQALRAYLGRDAEDVRVVFWDPVQGATFIGGYWVGDDRNVVLLWSSANGLVDAKGNPSRKALADLQPATAEERRLTRQVREEMRFAGRPVVPTDIHPARIEQAPPGTFEIEYFDGWEERCNHESTGTVLARPGRCLLPYGHIL